MLDSWGDDTFDFVRHQVPRIVAVLIIAFILTRLLKAWRGSSAAQQQPGPAVSGPLAATAHALQRHLQRGPVHHHVCCGAADPAAAGH